MNLAAKTAMRAAQRPGSRVAYGRARSAGMRSNHVAVNTDILQISRG